MKKKKDFPQISELSFHAIKVSIQKKKKPYFPSNRNQQIYIIFLTFNQIFLAQIRSNHISIKFIKNWNKNSRIVSKKKKKKSTNYQTIFNFQNLMNLSKIPPLQKFFYQCSRGAYATVIQTLSQKRGKLRHWWRSFHYFGRINQRGGSRHSIRCVCQLVQSRPYP